MSPKSVLIALAALLATSSSLNAEESKAEESNAEQPYTEQLGDKQVTSVKREITKGVGLSREELLQAAREAVPITISPPATDTNPDEQR
jgi:hypothetical protein